MSWAPNQIQIGKSLAGRTATPMRFSGRNQSRAPVLLCLSHLRWQFVYQRPQHLMTRFARDHRVMFFEEPLTHDELREPLLEARYDEGVEILVPHLPSGLSEERRDEIQRQLIDTHLPAAGVPPSELILWYYTPMSQIFTRHLQRSLTIYDCMDELSAFMGAPPKLLEREKELLERADLVFTGGYSLFEAKRERHPNVHPFPSSVDIGHFAKARGTLFEPGDQSEIPHPRLGFYGVIDERFDLKLVAELAERRSDWQIVLIGPVVKIDESQLPRRDNIHYLGPKVYDVLPHYLQGWDVATLPFALNDSTRFISPTKTPEYLAGGCPVVSTPIRDVVRHYGDSGVVQIADGADAFEKSIEAALRQGADRQNFLTQADAAIEGLSWERTCAEMGKLMVDARGRSQPASTGESHTVSMDSARRGRSLPAARRSGFDYLIVGAGFAGSVLAERLATQANKRVLVIDRRPHIGGNAYDCFDDGGVLMHRYGPHIFHTNAQRIFDYLSKFTRWRPYEHRVLADVDQQLVPIPINQTTLNKLYGLNLDEAGAAQFLAGRATPIENIRTSEDVVISQVGQELYEKFFRGYTRKQWGLDPSQLDKAVTARVPTRTNTDDRYFGDSFQFMPLHGYTRMFENMLDHPNIRIMVNTDFEDIRNDVHYDHLIYSGPIDEFFDYRFGKLPYRSLQFEHKTLDREWFQPVAVVNYPSQDVPYTRITEYKHLTGQVHGKTSLTYEYPSAEGDPYYPIPREENQVLYRQYRELADKTPNVSFVGRLGTYRYYNMDQVVGQAITLFNKLIDTQNGESQDEPRIALRRA